MRKYRREALLFVSAILLLSILVMSFSVVHASNPPYYTYTVDNEQGLVRTSDAYIPKGQITKAGDVNFILPENVYIDHENYVYVTDPGHLKVFIFDPEYQYVDAIDYLESEPGALDGFNAVNSVFVTGDRIYVADSFRRSIFIFDRDAVLNRTPQYVLWLDDVDGSDDLSTGDYFYLSESIDDADVPVGSPVYEVEVIGQNEQNRDIVLFKDYETQEELFVKVDREDYLGKVFNWVTAEHESKTLLKHIIYAEKNVPIQIVGVPSAPVFQEGYTFAPRKVVVDTRGNIYIVGAQSNNGLIMLNEEGDFLTFFAGNPIRMPIVDQIRSLTLTETQKAKLRTESQIDIDFISGVAIDQKGFIYTVTSTLSDNVIKKLNVSGRNYFSTDTVGWVGAVDLWVGQYGNVIVIEEFGWINEYDSNGNLVFSFSVRSAGVSREGLLSLPKSIAVDSHDNLLVVDQGNKIVQVYEPTPFANAVHTAMKAYQDGDVNSALENWEYALEYATVFDIAHIGIGDAYVRLEQYDKALEHYQMASFRYGISNTNWEVRQNWLESNLETIFLLIIGLFTLRGGLILLNKKINFMSSVKKKYEDLRKNSQVFDELSYIFTFLKHPLDGYYLIKRHNRVSTKTATIIYILLAGVLILYYEGTNMLFLPPGQINILYQLFIISFTLVLWIVANYFVCLINDGEGSFKNVYVSTAMSFTPLLIFSPFIILISNVLTYQEFVFYSVPTTFVMIWTALLFFFMIKEIHNYEVGESFRIVFKSMFTMLIMGIFIFVIYSLNSQILNVGNEIIREMIQR